jgi:hypothetical protein
MSGLSVSECGFELSNECGTRAFNVVEYLSERVLVRIIRIENIQFAGVTRDETEQQLNFSLLLVRRGELVENADMTLIKGDNKIMLGKITQIELSCPMPTAVKAARLKREE